MGVSMNVVQNGDRLFIGGGHRGTFGNFLDEKVETPLRFRDDEKKFLAENNINKETILRCNVTRVRDMEGFMKSVKESLDGGQLHGMAYTPASAPAEMWTAKDLSEIDPDELAKSRQTTYRGMMDLVDIGHELGLWAPGAGIVFYTFMVNEAFAYTYGAMHLVKEELRRVAWEAADQAKNGMRFNGIVAGPHNSASSSQIPYGRDLEPHWKKVAALGWGEGPEFTAKYQREVGRATHYLFNAELVTKQLIEVTGGYPLDRAA